MAHLKWKFVQNAELSWCAKKKKKKQGTASCSSSEEENLTINGSCNRSKSLLLIGFLIWVLDWIILRFCSMTINLCALHMIINPRKIERDNAQEMGEKHSNTFKFH
jgi:hypothetical protein